jgi:hypothetical protein
MSIAINADSPIHTMDEVDESAWCEICEQPLQGTSWREISPDRFAHEDCILQ